MRILLTGASGFLGGIFCRELGQAHEITGLGLGRPAPAGARGLALDLLDADALAALLDTQDFDAVVHLAALSNPNLCQQQPDASRRINLEATANLAVLCAARGLPLAFASTDLVFDGKRGLYAEDATPSPVCLYGEHKALAEEAVLSLHPQGGLVCRLPLMYGRSLPGAACFLDGMLAQARRGLPLPLFTDEFRSPADAADVARGMVLALRAGARGILHLGGPERLSRLEFGEILRDCWTQGPTPILAPTSQAEAPMAAPRPPDVSLRSDRASALGWRPASARQALPGILA